MFKLGSFVIQTAVKKLKINTWPSTSNFVSKDKCSALEFEPALVLHVKQCQANQIIFFVGSWVTLCLCGKKLFKNILWSEFKKMNYIVLKGNNRRAYFY